MLSQITRHLKSTYAKTESWLSDMRFAVVIITLFAIALVYGTFMESYHGREFANKHVYKSWWFMGMQFMMFLSILTATLNRLPLKKALYGFYTLHSGLLILFLGSFITYVVGVDGILELMPNEPANRVRIEQDQFVITYPDAKSDVFELPTSAFPAQMAYEKDGLKIKRYLPFATLKEQWVKTPGTNLYEQSSAQYLLYNEMLSQDLTLSLHPESDYRSMEKLGPLSVHYMPDSLYSCFTSKNDPTGFIVWNTLDNTCHGAKEKGHEVASTPTGNTFLLIQHEGEILRFFPNFSPLPLNDDLSKKSDSIFRVFSRSLFQERPHLFLFGDKVAFYHERKKTWQGKQLSPNAAVKLPWMNFSLLLKRHEKDLVPMQTPSYIRPVQDQGQIIEGNIKAIELEFYGKTYWVRSDAPLALSNGDEQIRFQIKSKEIRLPYQITLKRFKMDTNPGTNDPASYESFVSLLDGRTQSKALDAHVFMNNPLQYDDFTFYQSSYFEVGPGEYGSAFSVNYDPGRFPKYLGSFLLVFGSIWHFSIRRRKKNPFFARQSNLNSTQDYSQKG